MRSVPPDLDNLLPSAIQLEAPIVIAILKPCSFLGVFLFEVFQRKYFTCMTIMLSSQDRQNTNIWSGGPRIFICNMFIPSNMIDIEAVVNLIKIKQFKNTNI